MTTEKILPVGALVIAATGAAAGLLMFGASAMAAASTGHGQLAAHSASPWCDDDDEDCSAAHVHAKSKNHNWNHNYLHNHNENEVEVSVSKGEEEHGPEAGPTTAPGGTTGPTSP